MKKISLLGSTGSIGLSTLDIVARYPDRFQIVGLAAGNNIDILVEQIRRFQPEVVAVKTEEGARLLSQKLQDKKTEILFGEDGMIAVATLHSATHVVSAIVGAAGLLPTLEALRTGKTVGLANKESMVIAGELMKRAGQASAIVPIDSEHSALFQCLQGQNKKDLSRLLLTASGGPFLNRPQNTFSSITVADALKHPNWSMGAKITIDSATMMNKGLEVMEARWLFDVSVDQIGVVVHPQSIIHSMVEYRDGTTLAQMGLPDMRVPIAYALTYPERVETGVASVSWGKLGQMTFFEPDFEKFPALKIAFEVSRQGQTYPAVLNAANEIAVEAFLKEKISFVQIIQLVQKTLEAHQPKPLSSLEDVLEADRWARECTQKRL